MKYFAILSVAALLGAATVSAQKLTDRQPVIGNHSLLMQGDMLVVDFTIELPAGFMSGYTAYVITPVLTSHQGGTELPSLSIDGRDYYYVAAESDTQTEHIRYKGGAQTLHYHYALAATQKLRRAGLRVDAVYRTICSYDCGRAAGSTTLADCGADLSPFAGKTQVLYYIPADYTEPGEAADDFGGKSVFRANAATPDRKLFDPAMKQVLAEYERMKNDSTIAIRYIDVCVSSSPDGKYALNESLAGTRAENIRATIYGQLEEEDRPMLRITAEAENWNTLSKALPASDIDDKAAVERILANYPEPDEREAALRELPEWPAVCGIFDQSRNCRIVIGYDKREKHAHACATDDRGFVESRLNAPAGYIAPAEAERIAALDAAAPHLNNAMVAALESGDYAKAEKYAERIPDNGLCPAIANNKAVLYNLTDRREKAEKYFRMAAEMPAADYNKGVMLLNEGREVEAARLLEPYMKNN